MKWLGLSINIKKPCLGRISALGRVAVAVIKMQCIMLYKSLYIMNHNDNNNRTISQAPGKSHACPPVEKVPAAKCV
jgi:hypothetical protein